jgi:hypothetical protein
MEVQPTPTSVLIDGVSGGDRPDHHSKRRADIDTNDYPNVYSEFSFGGQLPPHFYSCSPRMPPPTPTPLPANPAALTEGELTASLSRGAFVIAGLFVFAGILLRFRRT